MDEYELYPGQHTGEQIDAAVDVVQAAIDAASPTPRPDPAPDAYIPGVVDITQAPMVFWVSGDVIKPFETLPGNITLPTRGLLVSEVKDLRKQASLRCVKAYFVNISSLPQNVISPVVMGDTARFDGCEVIAMRLSNPSAQIGPWTVTASGRSVTLDGSISGTTDVEIYLADPGFLARA